MIGWIWISRLICFIFGAFIGIFIAVKHYKNQIEQKIINNAIDDFDKFFQDKMKFGYVHIDEWNDFIEQLKEGVSSENKNQ